MTSLPKMRKLVRTFQKDDQVFLFFQMSQMKASRLRELKNELQKTDASAQLRFTHQNVLHRWWAQHDLPKPAFHGSIYVLTCQSLNSIQALKSKIDEYSELLFLYARYNETVFSKLDIAKLSNQNKHVTFSKLFQIVPTLTPTHVMQTTIQRFINVLVQMKTLK